jgi:hypothetical protein
MEVDIEKLKEELKAEIKAEVVKELTNKDHMASNKERGPFAEIRNKYRKRLYEVFGVYHYAVVWDNVRRLSCYMAGVKYLRELTPSLEIKAAEYAEQLCIKAIESRENNQKP